MEAKSSEMITMRPDQNLEDLINPNHCGVNCSPNIWCLSSGILSSDESSGWRGREGGREGKRFNGHWGLRLLGINPDWRDKERWTSEGILSIILRQEKAGQESRQSLITSLISHSSLNCHSSQSPVQSKYLQQNSEKKSFLQESELYLKGQAGSNQ